jgi:hypothetical protein
MMRGIGTVAFGLLLGASIGYALKLIFNTLGG